MYLAISIIPGLLIPLFFPLSFDNFSVLGYENKKYLLQIKKSLLIMRDKPSLNRNINYAPLYLFHKASLQVSYYESYYGESIRHLDRRSGAICDHLLHCKFLPSFDNFSVLAYENKKYLLEI